MNDKSTTTATTTAVQITEAEDEAGPSLDARFHYDPADPFAVTMVIESTGGPERWTFARELLIEGFHEPTGDGDVHVWPCLDTEGAAVVIVELESPAGGTLLQFRARVVHEFISASLATVPWGSEQLDVDAWIEQLLADADTSAD
jgi:hypothetical protein